MGKNVWRHRAKARRTSVMAISLLLFLQPFASIFSSYPARALDNGGTTVVNSVQPPSEQNALQDTLAKPTNGKPDKEVKPLTDFDLTWDEVPGLPDEDINYIVRFSTEITPEGELSDSEQKTTSEARLSFTETGKSEGALFWQVKATGEDSRESEWSDIWRVTIDTSLPTITISQPNGVYGGPQTMSIPFSAYVEDAGGIKSAVVVQSDGTPLTSTDNEQATANADEPVTHITLTGTIDAGSLSEGTHSVTVVVEDIAGNKNILSRDYFVDKTAPQLTPNIIDSQTLAGIVDVNMVVEDTTLESASITILDGENMSITLELPEAEAEITAQNTETVKWDTRKVNDGTYRIQFFGKDVAGNETLVIREVMVKNAPAIGVTKPIDAPPPIVDPLLDQLSKQLTQPFPAPQGFDVSPTMFTDATEGVGGELASVDIVSNPETDQGIKPIAVAPTESGWQILGVLWYWWLLFASALSVVIFKWRSILDAMTLVLRR